MTFHMRAQSLVGPDRLRLLGVVRQLPPTGGWDDPDDARLWRYNLHYFDDLGAVDASSRRDWQRALMTRWIHENPPASGTAWEPYPTSLRIANWVKGALSDLPLDTATLHSLAVQTRWLARRLEHHLQGNHLIANAKALIFAGCFMGGGEGDAWLADGIRLMEVELTKQLLPDGGHYELSPMYHAIVLEDLLDAINVLRGHGLAEPPEWPRRAARMLQWLGVVTHPDGEIAFFNDAAFGIAAEPAALSRYAARLGLEPAESSRVRCARLQDSGYFRLCTEDATVLVDCAEVGPQHLPAHAHADTLSFEMSLGKDRVLVNSGTSEYGGGPERQRQRSTAAHNTVGIDAQDSSEVWAGFRVARRAHPLGLRIDEDVDTITVNCAHDGYRRLRGANIHHRQWRLAPGLLQVDDRIDGSFGQAVARFHLHPQVTVQSAGTQRLELRTPSGRILELSCSVSGGLQLQSATWHPAFGSALSNQVVQVNIVGQQCSVRLRW